jgi:hypothetical protein
MPLDPLLNHVHDLTGSDAAREFRKFGLSVQPARNRLGLRRSALTRSSWRQARAYLAVKEVALVSSSAWRVGGGRCPSINILAGVNAPIRVHAESEHAVAGSRAACGLSAGRVDCQGLEEGPRLRRHGAAIPGAATTRVPGRLVRPGQGADEVDPTPVGRTKIQPGPVRDNNSAATSGTGDSAVG